MTPVDGQCVRRLTPHPWVPVGQLGTIVVVHENGRDFWVFVDDGGFTGWTDYDQWEPIEKEVAP